MVGMGRQLAESLPVAQRLYARAADVLGYDLAELCFDGPENKLNSTVISQPALYVTSLAALEFLRASNPDIVDNKPSKTVFFYFLTFSPSRQLAARASIPCIFV